MNDSMLSMVYKAVIFDLFGTLVHKFPVDESISVLWGMAAVLDVDADAFTRLWFDTFNERHSGCFPGLEADIDYVSQKLGVQPGEDQLRQAAQINLDYVATHIVPRESAIELLIWLRENGYKIALVSNWSDEVPTVWNDIPLSDYFDVSVFSCRIGIMKPDPRIYHMACDRLALNPKDCLFVGDGDSSELSGASGVGMSTVLISDDRAEHWSGRQISSLDEIRELVSESK
ncbi:MAG: HAD-IA family hydrolase [Dehalococcoidales bacterium]|nr:MAG: HAD-IA family hydrolase [Dehalococcoidales bacterium]